MDIGRYLFLVRNADLLSRMCEVKWSEEEHWNNFTGKSSLEITTIAMAFSVDVWCWKSTCYIICYIRHKEQKFTQYNIRCCTVPECTPKYASTQSLSFSTRLQQEYFSCGHQNCTSNNAYALFMFHLFFWWFYLLLCYYQSSLELVLVCDPSSSPALMM